MDPSTRSPWLTVGPLLGLLGGAALLLAPTALAHVGGGTLVETRFSVPSWVLWAAGGLVVAGSFMLVAAFQRQKTGAHRPEPGDAPVVWHPDEGLPAVVGGPRVGNGTLLVTRGIGMLLWLLAVMPWFLPFLHPTPRPDTLFWTLTWALFPIVVVILGDVWALFDPLRTMGAWIRTTRKKPVLHVPEVALGIIGLTLFVAVVATEIVWSRYAATGITGTLGLFASDLGDLTAGAIVAYTLLNVLAMFLFGVERWLTHGEAIGRFFRTWSTIAMRLETPRGVRWALPGRHPGRALTGCAAPQLVVAMLVAVNFDSLAHSAWGATLVAKMQGIGAPGALPTVAMLVAMLALFGVVWWQATRRVVAKAEDLEPRQTVSYALAPILLPIAFGYHLAHNLEQGIAALPRLFPAAWVGESATGIAWGATMGTFWALFQVIAILAGHLVAVLVSHDHARERYASRIQAFRAEIPLTLVMVVYTLIGLALVGAPAPGGVA